jgi:hypothetical protein
MNNRRFIIRAAIVTGFLAAVTLGVQQAVAHHAFAAEFDGKSPVLLRGKVTKIEWINPHAWIHINVIGTDAKEQEWIVVRGYQSKDKVCIPVCKANGRDMTFPDGRKLFMGSSGTGAPKDGADPNETK